MKTFTKIKVLLLCIFLGFGVGNFLQAQNLIQNASFEDWTDDKPDHWLGSKSNIGEANTIKSEDKHAGHFALQLINVDKKMKRFSTGSLSVVAGETYKATFWVKGKGDIRFGLYDNTYIYNPEYMSINSDVYVERSQIVKAVNTIDAAEFIFAVRKTVEDKGHLIIDDVVIEKVDTTNVPPYEGLVCNNSFENWTVNKPDCWFGKKTTIAVSKVEKSEDKHTGTYAVQLINDGGGHKRFSSKGVSVEAGLQYSMTYFVKGKGDIRVGLFDARGDASGYSYSQYSEINSDEYIKIVELFTATNAIDTAEFIFSVKKTVAANGHLIIDDVVIEKVETIVELSSDATLSSISYNGTAIEGFSAGTLEYNVVLDNSTAGVPELTCVTSNENASVAITNAQTIPGTSRIIVTAQDGSTSKTYIVNFTTSAVDPIELSSDATLSSISYNGTAIEGFSAGTLEYNVVLDNSTAEVPELTCVTSNENASVAITNAQTIPGTSRIIVTAQDGLTSKTYIVNFTTSAVDPIDPPYEGLVCNNSFENWTDNKPNCWYGSRTNINKVQEGMLVKSEVAKSGIAAVQLKNVTDVADEHKRFTSQFITVDENADYKITYWVKGKGKLRVGLMYSVSGLKASYTDYDDVDNNEFIKYEHTVKAKINDSESELVFSLYNTVAANGHLIIDVVVIEKVETIVELSSDATLSSISYNGTAIEGFSAGTLEYNVVLDNNNAGVPELTCVTSNENASVAITNAQTIPGTSTILVTAQDGSTSKNYIVNFTTSAVDPIDPPYEGLVCNNSFENWTDNKPNCWYGSRTNINKVQEGMLVKSEVAKSGTAAVQLKNVTDVADEHKRFTSQFITVDENADYKITYWVKGKGKLRVGLMYSVSGLKASYTDYDDIDNNEFIKYEHTVKAKINDSESELVFSLYNTVAANGHLIIDVVVIEKVETIVELSSDATLSSISYNGTAIEGFSAGTLEYNVVLDNSTAGVPELTCVTSNENASVAITNAQTIPGISTILVTAQDGSTSKTYIVNFTTSAVDPIVLSSDATLSSISYNGTAIEGFSAGTLEYNVVLDNNTAEVPELTCVTSNENASVAITNAQTIPGTSTILVTAQDESTSKTYIVNFSTSAVDPIVPPYEGLVCNHSFENWTVNKPDCWFGKKTNIAVSKAKKSEDKHTGTYAVQLINDGGGHKRFSSKGVSVEAGLQYSMTYFVKGKGDIRVGLFDARGDASGYSYSQYSEINSDEYIKIVELFTATNAIDTAEFIFSVKKTVAANGHLIIDDVVIEKVETIVELSSDATLSSISYNGTAIEGFSAGTLEYNVVLDNSTAGVPELTCVTSNENASVAITNAQTIPGTSRIIVTAQDGSTSKTYIVNFTTSAVDPIDPPYEGLVCNNSFENWTGNKPDCWFGKKTNIAVSKAKKSEDKHTGTYAVQLINDSGSHKRFSSKGVSVEAGVEYSMTYFVKGKGDIRVGLFDAKEDAYGYSYSQYSEINSDEYIKIVELFTATNAIDTAEFIFSVKKTVAENGHLIIDDVVISLNTIVNPRTITATAGDNGSIDPSGAVIVEDGKEQVFKFLPNAGYIVDKVLVDGNPVDVSDNTYAFDNVIKDYTISVSFIKDAGADFEGIVCNNSFENWSDDKPECWVGSKTNPQTDNFKILKSQDKNTGEFAVQLINDAQDENHKRFSTKTVSVVAGKEYSITYWVKGKGDLRIGLFDNRDGNSHGFVYAKYRSINSNEFVKYTDKIKAENSTSIAEFILSVKKTDANKSHLIIDDVLIELSSGNSISNLLLDDMISLYPNPAASVLNVDSEMLIDNIILTNIGGQQIAKQNVSANNAVVNIQNLSNGIYFVKIKIDDKIIIKRFVVNK